MPALSSSRYHFSPCRFRPNGRINPKPRGASCPRSIPHNSKNSSAFEPISKRRKGFPSETRVKRGVQIVHGHKELIEKLGRNDPCPCGSGRRF
ncbi:MAG: SEC-C metal-binding domain-containing protein [Phycisphaerales bacterium JB063]